ncbi:hypothetical protein [Streptomyces ossamyceticus]|uniref:DUF1616 domain-containing protein n=1 Tax=Streptomyces ossamyceticus TaxID=249581 RepID=A0ABV2V6L6_9ACTN
MTTLRWCLALSGWAALAAVTLLPEGNIPRAVVTTAFLLVCPGLAAARWARSAPLRATDRTAVGERALLALVLSLSLAVLAVEPMFLGGTFTTVRAMLALAAVTSLLALLPGPGGGRRRSTPATPATPPEDAPEPAAERPERPDAG